MWSLVNSFLSAVWYVLPANRRILDKIKIFNVQVIEKAQKKFSFLFVGKGKLFIKDCSLKNSLHCRALGLFQKCNQGSDVLDNFKVHFLLYGQGITFQKEIYLFINVS